MTRVPRSSRLATAPGSSTIEVKLDSTIAGKHEPLRKVAPQIPGWLDAVVSRALSREAADRYPDASALAEALARGPEGARTGPSLRLVAVALVASASANPTPALGR